MLTQPPSPALSISTALPVHTFRQRLARIDPRTWLIAIVMIGLLVRIITLIALAGTFGFDATHEAHGIKEYSTYAQNLLSTGIYGLKPGISDATLPPLYTYALAGVYRLFGVGYLQVGLLNSVLDTVTVVLVYQIARRLFPVRVGQTVGLLAALFTAVYPYLIFQDLTVIDTALFTMMLHLFLFLIVLIRDRALSQPNFDRVTLGLTCAAGIVLGLTALSRAIVAPLAIFVAVWLLFSLPLRRTVVRLVPIAVLSVLVLIPWTVRNYQVFHQFVAVSSNSGMNFWFGSSRFTIPFFEAGYHTQWATSDIDQTGMTQIQSDNALMQDALAYLRAHPDQIPKLLWIKFLAFWSIDIFPRNNPVNGQTPVLNPDGSVSMIGAVANNDPVAVYSQPIFDQLGRIVQIIYFGTLLILAVISVPLTFRQGQGVWRSVSLIWLTLICMTLIYVIFVPTTRYRAPIDPLVFMLSAYTLVILVDRVRHVGQFSVDGLH